MGLSNGERFSGVLHIISHLSKMRFKAYQLKPLNKFLKGLWSAFLGRTRNSAHWILGSESDSTRFGEISMLRIAFEQHLGGSEYQEQTNKTFEDCIEDLKEANPDYYTMAKFFEQHKPNTVRLLDSSECDSPGDAWVLWKRIESYFYYANRYQDEFAKTLWPVTKILCDMKGFLWDVFATNPAYFDAFMLEAVVDKIVIEHQEKDPLNLLFMKQNMHHDVRLGELTKKELYETFKEFQVLTQPLSMGRRVLTLLKLMGRHNEYEHQHKEQIKMMEDWNKANPKEKIDIDEAKKLLAASLKKAEDYKNNLRTGSYSRYCNLTQQTDKDDMPEWHRKQNEQTAENTIPKTKKFAAKKLKKPAKKK